MPNFKNSRMAEDIRRELTAIFRELKDPRIDKMLTIIRADLSGDMSSCKVGVRHRPEERFRLHQERALPQT